MERDGKSDHPHLGGYTRIKIGFDIECLVQNIVRNCFPSVVILQLEIYHPSMYRAYFRKNDMDQPPLLDDDSSEDGEATSHSTAESKVKEQDESNLEARFYRFGVRPEFLQIQRILQHRYV